MNTLKLNKLTYKFQDLLLQNKMPTLKVFKKVTCKDFFISTDLLEKIYAFIETLQQRPKKYSLIQAFEHVFKMVLIDMILLSRTLDYNDEYENELFKRKDLLMSELSLNLKYKKKYYSKKYKCWIMVLPFV